MTDKCKNTAEGLAQFYKSNLCDNVTTENMLLAWIMTNDALDIYSTLKGMVDGHSLYGEDNNQKLGELKHHIELGR